MPAVPQMRSDTGRGVALQCIRAQAKGGRGIMNDKHTHTQRDKGRERSRMRERMMKRKRCYPD